MKKILAVLVLLLIVAIFFAPFFNGLIMEKIVTRSQSDLNEMYADTGSDVIIDIINYDRKFSTSEIEWRVRLGSLSAIYGIDEVILIDRAEHGYTGVISKTSLEKNPWYADLINNKIGGKDPLNITTTYSLPGNIKSVINVGAFSFKAGNDTVDFHPGRIVTECDQGVTHLLSTGSWDGLAVADKVKIEGFSLKYNLDKISTYIWDGKVSYEMGNIKIADKAENFELANLKGDYSLDYDEEKNIVSTSGKVKIDTILAGNKSVKDSSMKLDVNNLDARSYEEFMALYTRNINSILNATVSAKKNPDKVNKALEQQMANIGIQMMAAYERFLKKGLELKITDLHARLTEGTVTGDIEIILNQDITFAQMATIAIQPNLAASMVSLRSDISFPAELADESTLFISPLYQGMPTGLFVKNGEMLVHSAQTKDGKLLLNGNEVVFN